MDNDAGWPQPVLVQVIGEFCNTLLATKNVSMQPISELAEWADLVIDHEFLGIRIIWV